jgi:hypothetical protein
MLKKLFNKIFRRKRSYFISYFSSDTVASLGFGNAIVSGTIKTMDDIQFFEDKLNERDGRKYTIINFRRI